MNHTTFGQNLKKAIKTDRYLLNPPNQYDGFIDIFRRIANTLSRICDFFFKLFLYFNTTKDKPGHAGSQKEGFITKTRKDESTKKKIKFRAF